MNDNFMNLVPDYKFSRKFKLYQLFRLYIRCFNLPIVCFVRFVHLQINKRKAIFVSIC